MFILFQKGLKSKMVVLASDWTRHFYFFSRKAAFKLCRNVPLGNLNKLVWLVYAFNATLNSI